jgi:hypothetical protein
MTDTITVHRKARFWGSMTAIGIGLAEAAAGASIALRASSNLTEGDRELAALQGMTAGGFMWSGAMTILGSIISLAQCAAYKESTVTIGDMAGWYQLIGSSGVEIPNLLSARYERYSSCGAGQEDNAEERPLLVQKSAV